MGGYENMNELQKAAEKRLGKISDSDWEAALWETEIRSYGSYDDTDLKVLLNALADRDYTPKSKQKRKSAIVGAAARAELREREVRDSVKKVRQKLFDTSKPPFPDDPDTMASWIRKERAAMPEGPIRTKQVAELLEWAGEGGYIQCCAVVQGTTLDKLGFASLEVARRCGWQKEQATNYILTGAVPIVDPIVTKTTRAISIFGRGSYSITVNSPEVSPQKVAKVAGELREKVWGVKRAREPTEEDVALVKLVLDTPGLKWEDRRVRWNKQRKEWTNYDNVDQIRMAFDRAYSRVMRPVIWKTGDHDVVSIEKKD